MALSCSSANWGRARPLLLIAPTFDDLGYAAGLARGASLCVTEWPDVPLAGWADAAPAWRQRPSAGGPRASPGSRLIKAPLHPMWVTLAAGQARLTGNGPDDGAFGPPAGRTMRLAAASDDSEPDGHTDHRGKELL